MKERESFTIHKHAGGDWSIAQLGRVWDRLCWDEMLSVVAQILLTGTDPKYKLLARKALPFAAIWSLEVSAIEDGVYWTIRRGMRFIDHLGSGEALGFIAAYTLTDGERQLFSGMRTYQELCAARMLLRPKAIAGLITHQPEYVA